MNVAYGEVNNAKWVLDAQGNFRTLVISGYDGKEEKLRFRLDEISVYLYCKDGKPYEIGNKLLYSILTEIITFIADTDEIEDAVNEIMIALL